MATEIFLSAVKALAERGFSLVDVISTAEALKARGRSDFAGQIYKLWTSQNQDSPLLHAAYFNQAVTMAECGDLPAAQSALEHAVRLKPDFYPARFNLGGILERQGAAGEAMAQWRSIADNLAAVTGSSIKFKTMALRQLARVLGEAGQAETAEGVLAQSLEIDASQRDVAAHFVATRMAAGKWPVLAPIEGVEPDALMRHMSPLSAAAIVDDPIYQLAGNWNHSHKEVGDKIPFLPEPTRPPDAADSSRLRIGYVSSDMRNHAVGSLMSEVFELHDRSKVESFTYYCGAPGSDPIQERIRSSVDHWIDINGIDDLAAARRIQSDGINILVDLNGHTKGCRTKIFALRPAPVNVNWLGFPGSMGTPYHHYIIADDWIIPKDYEIYFSEKVVRLPCYQPNDRKRPVSQRPPRAQAGLPEEAVVYCCFNGLQKINRRVFECWMRILERVPNSVLWLLDCGEEGKNRLRQFAAQGGIAPQRLVFAQQTLNADHLARYPLADLFLDTWPYGAHTTASDALWMGVPILTLSGRGFASRVCGSLSRAAGLGELVCGTADEYVERAVELGHRADDVKRLKGHLEAKRNSCTLFNMDLLVQSLEGLYRKMWQDYLRGRLPKPDLSNLDLYLEAAVERDIESCEMAEHNALDEWYRQKLLQRHRVYPIHRDGRLWRAPDFAEGGKAPVAQS
jgi:predicted O-linked N-acetylglucosamine transferase (SPINDLY family)